MWPNTTFAIRFQLTYPIVQAGMAGGPTTPELVAAVSNAGALGTIGAGYLKPTELRRQIQAVRTQTNRSFCVNLFIPNSASVEATSLQAMQSRLHTYRTRLGVESADAMPDLSAAAQLFEEQFAVVLEERVPVFQCTFGEPTQEMMAALRQSEVLVIGSATTVREALQLEQRGVDAVTVQGSEAGGHRGTFVGVEEHALVGTMALVPQVVDRVDIPVIAAGGIMDGRGIVASLALGAVGVQLGTAFLTCLESGAHPVHQQAVLQSSDDSTTLTRAFSGKLARGIRNAFSEELSQYPEDILPYPVQNALTQDIRRASAVAGNPSYMSLWAGQAAPLACTLGAGELVRKLATDTEARLRQLTGVSQHQE